jgi:flagellar basal-body rod modification protein FlgD
MSTSSVSAATASTQTLSQDDFLQLMVAQLTTQDPLNPTSDTDFAAQLAQFSALEQTKEIGADVVTLNAGQQLSQAQSLLGQTVEISSDDTTVTGVVQSVEMVDGVPQLNVDGTLYNLSDVTAITNNGTL